MPLPKHSEGLLHRIQQQVWNLRPGECLTVDRDVLREIGSAEYIPGYIWTPIDRIMEGVIGAAWTMRFTESMETGDVTFQRLERESQERTYLSPDRRGTR